MAGIAYLFAVALAVALVIAGVAKLVSLRATAGDFRGLGVPGALALPVAMTELALGAALVLRPRLAGAVAVVVLVAFSGVLVRAIRRGASVPCGCFGGSRRDPVSIVDVARNGVLAVFGVGALAAAGPAAPDVFELITASTFIVTIWVVLGLFELRHAVGAVWDNTLAGSILRDEAA